MLTEAVLTLGLVSVILGTASGARNVGINGALVVGGYIGLVSMWGAPVSGASMNPIRSIAPGLVAWDLTNYWIYLVGPILGAMVAVGFEWILKGKSPRPTPRPPKEFWTRTSRASDPPSESRSGSQPSRSLWTGWVARSAARPAIPLHPGRAFRKKPNPLKSAW